MSGRQGEEGAGAGGTSVTGRVSGGVSGRVTLVGAGPGDPDLLTLKALRALEAADVVLYDSLVTAEVLALARRGAPRICVGKRAGRPSCRQDDINALMGRLARDGKHVVRLKSGDPSVFGRSAEEMESLQAAGIAVTVIPGITTASAMAAGAGVSLTRRGAAQSVRFITAHGAKGGLPDDLDWAGLSHSATSLIVYMGARTSAALARRLIAAGRAPSTPVLVATNVSRPDETRCAGTLGDLAEGRLAMDHASPVILAIGEAFAASDAVGTQEGVPAPQAQAIGRT